MRPRVALARLLIRIGGFIQATAMMVMRPDDLIEFGRRTYSGIKSVAGWSSSELIDEGLYPEEEELLQKIPYKQGRLLLLGVGGGREAIPLAKMGFQITGVDFVPEMVEQAKINTARNGFVIEGMIQEISRLEVKASSFDLAWLSARMYSCIPTRKRRIEMLRRINGALRSNGYFVCQFHRIGGQFNSPRMEKAGKALAWLTLGNTSYEPGDMLWHNIEFIHGFYSAEELFAELTEGGFEVIHLHLPHKGFFGGAVLRKSEDKVMLTK